jgi:hypothetical protein
VHYTPSALRALARALRDPVQRRLDLPTPDELAAALNGAAETIEAQGQQALECGCHHEGYVIGMHWLAVAYERICAGEPEAEVMEDYGYTYENPKKTLEKG